MYLSFQYAQKNAIYEESKYPYNGRDNACKDKGEGLVKAIKPIRVTPDNGAQLRAAITAGPVSVAVAAGNMYFQGYYGGILNAPACKPNLDHGITAVGYGSENGVNYYIVKNSWGSSWGESGYIRLAATESGPGTCGVQREPVTTSTN